MENMIRPCRASKTPPTGRRGTTRAGPPQVSKRDLRHCFDFGVETLAAAGETADASEKEVPEDGEDA